MTKKRQIMELVKPYMTSIGFTEVLFDEENTSLRFRSQIINGFQKEIHFDGVPSSWYISEEVNKHLTKIIDISTDNNYETIKNHYIEEKVWQAEADVFRDLPFKTKADKEAYLARLQQHIEEYILPFFELYPNLQTFHDTILDKIPFEDKLKYIPGQNNIKALIIFKLFDNPKYDELKVHIAKVYERDKKAHPDYVHLLEKKELELKKAIEYLESEEFKTVQNK